MPFILVALLLLRGYGVRSDGCGLSELFGELELLVQANATVDAEDDAGDTPLQLAIGRYSAEAADFLLCVGARTSKLRFQLPAWFQALLNQRVHCRESCYVLYGVLRVRWRVGGQRVPRDMIRLLTQMVWGTRREEKWLWGE